MFIIKLVAVVVTGLIAMTVIATEEPSSHIRKVVIPPLAHIKNSNLTTPIMDLSGPDVIFQDGIYVKPLKPGGSFGHSKTGLNTRSDGYCSTYSYCYNAYVYIPSGEVLQSYLTIPYGDGDSLDGNDYGIYQNFSGSTIITNGGDLGSYDTVNLGCLLWTEYIDCFIQASDSGASIGSHNCLGYDSC
jgi:hypothetical protein